MKTYSQFNEGLKDYTNQGKSVRVPGEDTASFKKLFKNSLKLSSANDWFEEIFKNIIKIKKNNALEADFLDPQVKFSNKMRIRLLYKSTYFGQSLLAEKSVWIDWMLV